MKHVHRPRLIVLEYPTSSCAANSTHGDSLGLLRQVRLGAMPVGSLAARLEELLARFRDKAESVHVNLGAWAADYFVIESCRSLVNQTAIDSENLWADAGRRSLEETLSVFSTKERMLFSSQDAVSAKVDNLLSFLAKQHHDAFSGIIFVQERVTAHTLAAVVTHHPMTRELFRCHACVGSTQRMKKWDIWDNLDLADVHDTLRHFRDGGLNLVIATNVLEEGIDLTACNVVVCFDQPSNIKSFIQRRGRARQEKSTFAIMISSDCESKMISQWQDLEEEMSQLYQDQKRKIRDLEALEVNPEPVPFRLRLPTGLVNNCQSRSAGLTNDIQCIADGRICGPTSSSLLQLTQCRASRRPSSGVQG